MDTAIVTLLSIIALCQILLLLTTLRASGETGPGLSWPTLPYARRSGPEPGVYTGDEDGPSKEELEKQKAIPNDMMKHWKGSNG